ncbi:MAG: ribosomal protein L7/L12 [Lachnospiraceae bacterium]|nr:ribosomal protein L7/L12 [Lachnospiraceae bacterium]
MKTEKNVRKGGQFKQMLAMMLAVLMVFTAMPANNKTVSAASDMTGNTSDYLQDDFTQEIVKAASYPVILTDAGEQKTDVIRVIREVTGLGLKEAKNLVDNVPSVIAEYTTLTEARSLLNKITEVGGSGRIDGDTPVPTATPEATPISTFGPTTPVNVNITSVGTNKMTLIKCVKNITNVSLTMAQKIVEHAPCAVFMNIPYDDAIDKKAQLESAGATVELSRFESFYIRIAEKVIEGSNFLDVLKDGVFSYDPYTNTLYVDGDYNDIESKYAVIENGTDNLTINVMSNSYLSSYISLWADTTITGRGCLTMNDPEAYVISPQDCTLTVKNANLNLSGFVAIGSYHSSVRFINSNAKLTGTNHAIEFKNNGLELEKCHIVDPTQYQVKGVTLTDEQDRELKYVEIVKDEDPSATPTMQPTQAPTATPSLSPTATPSVSTPPTPSGSVEHYGLTIAGCDVTSINCSDILGDGVFSYHPQNKTLYICGNKDVSDISGYPKPIIESDIQNLTIYTEDDSELGGYIELCGDTTFTGEGHLLVSSSWRCINTEDASLTIKDADLELDGFVGICGDNNGIRIIDSKVYVHVTNSGITYADYNFSMEDCYVVSPEGCYIDEYSLWLNGESVKELKIAPGEGFVPTVPDTDSPTPFAIPTNQPGPTNIPGPIDLFTVPSALPTGTSSNFNLKVCGIDVSPMNWDDITGDGVFSYDFSTRTLHIKGDSEYSANSDPYIINTDVDGITLSVDSDSHLGGTIKVDNNTVLTGDGKLTIEANGSGIYFDKNLSIVDANMEVYAGYGIVNGIRNGSLTISDSYIYVKSMRMAIGDITNFIKIEKCNLVYPDDAGVIMSNGTYRIGFDNGNPVEELRFEPYGMPIATEAPIATPTKNPTAAPTKAPTAKPTATPASAATATPTVAPTTKPGEATAKPGATPTEEPTTKPGEPTTKPGATPTGAPTTKPGEPTMKPGATPTGAPTTKPGEPTAKPGEPTAKPTVAPTVNPGSDPVVEFVNRVYRLLLDRDPSKDPSGVNYWTNILKTNNKDGAPFGGARLVQYFIVGESGKEYTSKKKTNEDFLLDMYAVLMGRNRDTIKEEDAGGFAYWMGRLDVGEGRELIMKAMANCPEFINICDNAGIKVGDFVYYEYCSKNPELAKFVARMYTKAMDRSFDGAGLEYWVSAIVKKEQSINSLSTYFFNCEEFVGYNLTMEEKVKRLYRTFFDREGEEEGLNYWLSSIENGSKTWKDAYSFFIVSSEFKDIRKKFGL